LRRPESLRDRDAAIAMLLADEPMTPEAVLSLLM